MSLFNKIKTQYELRVVSRKDDSGIFLDLFKEDLSSNEVVTVGSSQINNITLPPSVFSFGMPLCFYTQGFIHKKPKVSTRNEHEITLEIHSPYQEKRRETINREKDLLLKSGDYIPFKEGYRLMISKRPI